MSYITQLLIGDVFLSLILILDEEIRSKEYFKLNVVCKKDQKL